MIYNNSYKTLIVAKIIKIEDLGFNTLSDKKPYKNILFLHFDFYILTIRTKLLLVQNHCVLFTVRWMSLLKSMMELNI